MSNELMRLVETKVQWTLKSIDDSDLFLFMSHVRSRTLPPAVGGDCRKNERWTYKHNYTSTVIPFFFQKVLTPIKYLSGGKLFQIEVMLLAETMYGVHVQKKIKKKMNIKFEHLQFQ